MENLLLDNTYRAIACKWGARWRRRWWSGGLRSGFCRRGRGDRLARSRRSCWGLLGVVLVIHLHVSFVSSICSIRVFGRLALLLTLRIVRSSRLALLLTLRIVRSSPLLLCVIVIGHLVRRWGC